MNTNKVKSIIANGTGSRYGNIYGVQLESKSYIEDQNVTYLRYMYQDCEERFSNLRYGFCVEGRV